LVLWFDPSSVDISDTHEVIADAMQDVNRVTALFAAARGAAY
jgi:hypothetical protein